MGIDSPAEMAIITVLIVLKKLGIGSVFIGLSAIAKL
jgi:hypothetical protein